MTYGVVSRVQKRTWRHSMIAGLFVSLMAGNAMAVTGDGSTNDLVGLNKTDGGDSESIQIPSLASALGEQRYNYNLAKSALRDNDMKNYQQYYELLGDYPLVPYLDYTILRARLWELPYDAVDAFFAKHPDSFLAIRLRQTWLSQLAADGEWPAYIRYYRPDVANTSHECHWLHARLRSGDTTALAETARIWNVGESQPEACDPLFAAWRNAGYLTQELIWSRFDKAMQRRNLGLGRYLAAMLTDERRKLADLYMRVDRQPSLITQHREFRIQSLATQQIIAHGIVRLARHRAEVALKHWELYEAQQLFPKELGRNTKVTLVRYLARQDHQAEAEQLLSQSTALRQADVVEELLREALRDLDWQAVLRRINMLPEEEQTSDRWLYWRARAVGELGLADATTPKPEEIYRDLAGKRSFYGFLSSDILNIDYSLEDVPIEIRPDRLEVLEKSPGMRRAKELWLTGNYAEARAEWLFTTRAMNRDQLVTAGQLARQWGWYNKGIQAMIVGDLWDHLTIRFPLAYKEEIARIAEDTQLNPTLIYAIARQESAFAENAHSSAGARGLMQLMPATAELVARRKGMEHSLQDLYNPEHNMLLGSSYFHSLLERFGNNRILAAAAYNAGPHRVSNWISRSADQRPFDVWIETIPFRETRGYVQNVLSFSVIYGYRMGQATPLVTAAEAQDLL
jgi:soluble lytic murein transglycosylase